jgi:hypothetical protein
MIAVELMVVRGTVVVVPRVSGDWLSRIMVVWW